MKQTIFVLIAMLVGGGTFAFILKKFGGNCIP